MGVIRARRAPGSISTLTLARRWWWEPAVALFGHVNMYDPWKHRHRETSLAVELESWLALDLVGSATCVQESRLESFRRSQQIKFSVELESPSKRLEALACDLAVGQLLQSADSGGIGLYGYSICSIPSYIITYNNDHRNPW